MSVPQEGAPHECDTEQRVTTRPSGLEAGKTGKDSWLQHRGGNLEAGVLMGCRSLNITSCMKGMFFVPLHSHIKNDIYFLIILGVVTVR